MSFNRLIALAAISPLALTAACTNSTDSEISKADARAMGGKQDHIDLCELLDWYGDGICDDFCPRWDEDCGPATLQTCGGALDLECPSDHYCSYGSDGIGCNDGINVGVCQARPEICTEEFAPVCGCDGVTYDNACGANGEGASVASEGPCGTASTCETDEDCPQPFCLPGGPCPYFSCYRGECVDECERDEQCPSGYCAPGVCLAFCPEGDFDCCAPSTCQPRPDETL